MRPATVSKGGLFGAAGWGLRGEAISMVTRAMRCRDVLSRCELLCSLKIESSNLHTVGSHCLEELGQVFGFLAVIVLVEVVHHRTEEPIVLGGSDFHALELVQVLLHELLVGSV